MTEPVEPQGVAPVDAIPQGTAEQPWLAGPELRRSLAAADVSMNGDSALQRTFAEVERRLDDPRRLNSVRATLERPVPELVNVLVRALAADLDTAFAAVTVLDETHQHFLSTNMGVMESCEREGSKCQYVIGTGYMVAINNVKTDGFFKRLVNGMINNALPVQAYLGVPLKDEAGEILGAVCVVDDKPREWTATEHYALIETSAIITRILADSLPAS